MVACIYVTMLVLQAVTVNAQSPAILSVTNVIPGATATFECSLSNLASPTQLDIYKDNVPVYQCTNIAFPCGKSSLDNDYSDVTFTALGTAFAKGTFTVAHADQTRDRGEWTCKYGTSLISSSVTFVVSDSTPASDDCSWCSFSIHGSCWPCIVLIIVCIIFTIVVVAVVIWYCCCRHRESPPFLFSILVFVHVYACICRKRKKLRVTKHEGGVTKVRYLKVCKPKVNYSNHYVIECVRHN